MFTRFQWPLAAILLATVSRAFGHGMSEAEKQAIIDGGNMAYLKLGATHMLAGYDHLLFIFGMIFVLTKFRAVVKFITAFTIGHSITLILATFQGVQVNYFLIDAVIGLSVCYIAFANLDGFRKVFKINPPNMLFMIFGLGLIHGLGLSSRLQQLPLSEDHLLLNIISFNLGVEIGQVSALAAMLVLLGAFRKTQTFKTFRVVANHSLIWMGASLFLMQMHGYEHVAKAAEFSVNSESLEEASEILTSEWIDTINITVPAGEGLEYKFRLAEGARLEYQWQTDGAELYFDFHGEPKGDTTGYYKTFTEDTDSQSSGSLIAPFEGIHGWFWKNKTVNPAHIVLRAKGDYSRMD